jgi:hypothetical protein
LVNYFNADIVGNHNDIMMLNSWQVQFFNMMLTLPWLTDEQQDMYEDELRAHLCYDV